MLFQATRIIKEEEGDQGVLLHDYIPQSVPQCVVFLLELERGSRIGRAGQLHAHGGVSLAHAGEVGV